MFEFDNVITAGSVLVRDSIQSQNWEPSNHTAGWYIGADGTAYFLNVTAKGNVTATKVDVGSAPNGEVIIDPLYFSGANTPAVLLYTHDAHETDPGRVIAGFDLVGGVREGWIGLTAPQVDNQLPEFGIVVRQRADGRLVLDATSGLVNTPTELWVSKIYGSPSGDAVDIAGGYKSSPVRPITSPLDTTNRTTTSTVYTAALTPAASTAVVDFTAPASGCVRVDMRTLINATTAAAYGAMAAFDVVVMNAGVPGAAVYTGGDGIAHINGTTDPRNSTTYDTVYGLTPGQTYRARPTLKAIAAANPARIQAIYLTVTPQP